MKASFRVLGLLVLVICSGAQAAEAPYSSRGPFAFTVDTATFLAEDGSSWLELYTLVDAMQLEFIPVGNRFAAELSFSLTVVDTALHTVYQDTWTRKIAIREPKTLWSSLPFRDLKGLALRAGTYGVSLKVATAGEGPRGTVAQVVQVGAFPTDDLAASDVMFAEDIETREEGRFKKGEWEVVPNVTRTFVAGSRVLFYFEVYNLASRGANDEPFTLTYSLTRPSGELVRKYDAVSVPKPGPRAAKVGRLETEDLPAGPYVLVVEVFDSQSRKSVSTSRPMILAPARSRRAVRERRPREGW